MYVTAGSCRFERAWSPIFVSAASVNASGAFTDPAAGAYVQAINMLIEAAKNAHPEADALIHLRWQVDAAAKMVFISGEPVKRAK